MHPIRTASLGILLAISATPAFAWWGGGHMQIAAVAYAALEPDVREKVDGLIALNPDYPNWTSGVPNAEKAEAAFVHAATWADDIKRDRSYARDDIGDETAAQNHGYAIKIVHDYWHYVDLPFSTDETEVRPPATPNALTQIELLAEALASGADNALLSYDLVWLIHLVGDVHQPLHAAARFSAALDDDRGGNDEMVQPSHGSSVKLHQFWDSRLGGDMTPVEAIMASRRLPFVDLGAAAVTGPALWIIESFALAQNVVYTDLIGDGTGPFNLTKAYEDQALAVSQRQAALAGARLAGLINTALAK